jgi:hypothetical protein
MDPVQAFLQANALTPAPHAPGSRYYGVPTAHMTMPDGLAVVYLKRRFLPPASAFSVLKTVPVAPDDRLDTIAAQHLGDPLQWWRIADGNGAMLSEALVANVASQPAAALAITLPEGMAGAGDAE